MTNNKWQRVIALVCAMSFLVTSCTTLDHVSIPGAETTAALPAVQVGDSVLLTTKAGAKKTFKVTAVEPDALAGKNERVLYADMASLSVKRGDKAATAIAVGLVILGVLIIVGSELAGDGIADAIDTAIP